MLAETDLCNEQREFITTTVNWSTFGIEWLNME